MDFRRPFVVLLLIGFGCSGLPNGKSSNILAFLPTETRSHFNGFKPLLETLVARGHNLTLVSPFPLSPVTDDGSPLLYTHVQVEFHNKVSGVDFLDKNSETNTWPSYVYVLWLGPRITRFAVDKPSVKEFILNDGGRFDVVIIENFFHECFVALGHKYGAPVVQLLPLAANSRVSQWHGNPYHPAYIAELFNDYAAPMTFRQRVGNTVSAAFNTWVNRLVYMPQQRAIMLEHFRYPGHERRPDLDTMVQDVSLTLVNSHPLVSSVAPFVPGYVQVASMHVQPVKPLPRDLKNILDAAERGVIYFSLGSVIKSSKMPRETVALLLSEFAKIEQIVLWKWEDDQLPDLPKNVIVRKWFPQNDILSHPNCRLFITHGGIHSLIESIYHGVPMLLIPVFADQVHNAAEAMRRGFALYVPYFELTAEEFSEKLQTILQDPGSST
ncbi:UDP-glucuronosyltransferase 2B30-like isoform X2 [Sipha flava]|uniref:UDP-glucuronosyltransferase n=1 Tax=Sipha flava TaxID=143950 RepID=A0A8B8FES4_9HEMI|nr:UDP-glucuronosyltransferase 2B30-like isoform X2 [Sipha flava]